jgi:hypothetical protein
VDRHETHIADKPNTITGARGSVRLLQSADDLLNRLDRFGRHGLIGGRLKRRVDAGDAESQIRQPCVRERRKRVEERRH